MCRFYNGAEDNVYEKELKAAEVDNSHLPPPECMKEEYKLSPEKVVRLKNACTAFAYERFGVNEQIEGTVDNNRTNEYIAYGNRDFSVGDGTPISLKALLWNRYYHWGGFLADQDSFRKWYHTYYSSEPTNREKRAVKRRANLVAKCKYYHGEVTNPWDYPCSSGFNHWRKTYWNLEKLWVDELCLSYNSPYANHNLLNKWSVTGYFKKKGESLSLINHILAYHNYVAKNAGNELNGSTAIDGFENLYMKLIPLGSGVEIYFNFYAGEDKNPWTGLNCNMFELFWQWEHMIQERCKSECSNWIVAMTNSKLPHIKINWLCDETVPLEFKALCLFIDSMAEKWFPYGNKLDIDEQYLQGISLNI